MFKSRCKGCILAKLALTLAVCYAQPAVPSQVGALGNRYIEIGAGQEDPGDDLFDRKSVGALRFNFPLATAFDVGLGGEVRRTSGSTAGGMLSGPADVSTRAWTANIAATAYLRRGVVAPFLRASGGYEWLKQERSWSSSRFGPGKVESRDGHAVGVFGAGAEVLIKRVAVTPSLHYQDSYRNVFGTDLGGAWRADLAVHLWLAKSFGAFVHVSRTRPRWNLAEPLWSGDAGVRIGF